jgi:hypothetical protein
MQGRDGAERATSTCNASSWRRMTVSIQSSGGIQGGDVLGSYGQIVREIRATDISWVFSPWTSLMRTIVQMVMLIPGVLKKKKSFKPRQKKLRKNLRSCLQMYLPIEDPKCRLREHFVQHSSVDLCILIWELNLIVHFLLSIKYWRTYYS